jgi:hypothetical protein
MDKILFVRINEELVAIDEEKREAILNEKKKPMSPAEYYNSINRHVGKWSVEEKARFVGFYGTEEYKKLVRADLRAKEQGKMSTEEKVAYVKEHGREEFMKLTRER